MNRGLLIFALFMILAGIGSGLYIISLFGVLLLFSAVLSQRRPSHPVPVSQAPERNTRQMSRPMAAPTAQRAEKVTPAAVGVKPPVSTQSYMSAPLSSQTQSYSPALFPNTIFPSLAQMDAPTATEPAPAPETNQPDELIEMGALLALLKLAFG